MHILCPHCRNPIELVKLSPREEITCTSCGSSFRLETETTSGWQPAGQKLGRFELIETVGHGAFGTVHRARDPELDRTVAIKVPRAGNLAGPQELDRFLREARSVAQLRHPSIVSVHEVGQSEGVPYLVSDFVQGVTLADQLSARRPTFRESAELVASVADALQYAHEQGVVHRDVKPSNIMIGDDGKPCVMDFGLAKRDAGEITMTMEGQVLGTPAYMSPEQARGEAHTVDGRSDVYSLGVILYQLLTGELPFRGTKRMLLHQVLHDDPRPPRSLNDKIPRDLETICLKAMAKEPARRYGTAKDLAEDLRRWLAGEPIRARPTGRLERMRRWVRRYPTAAGLLLASGIAALALVGLAVGVVYNARLSESNRKIDQALQGEKEQREKAEGLLHVAEEAKQGEERQRKAAEEAQAGEAIERGKAEDALKRADRTAYFHRILLADLARKENDLLRAGLLLQEPKADLRDWEWRYLNAQCHTELVEVPAEAGMKCEKVVAFSPDGLRLATLGKDNTVKLWDAMTGKELLTLTGHTKAIRTLAFHPGGKQLASGGEDETIRVWDLDAGKEARTIKWDPTYALAYSPDGRQMVSLSTRGAFWDADTGKQLPTQFPVGSFTDDRNAAVAYSPDSRRVFVLFVSLLGSPLILDCATGKGVLGMPRQRRPYSALAYGPDGQVVATADWDGYVRLWDVANRRILQTISGGMKELRCVALSPDGRWVAAGGYDRVIKVWKVSNAELVRTFPGHAGHVVSLAFSPDGRRLASAGDDGKARIWDVNAVPGNLFLPVPSRHVIGLTFSPDGRHLAAASTTGGYAAQVFDVETGHSVRNYDGLGFVSGGPLAYSRDGRWLAVSGPDGKGTSLLDVKTGKRAIDLVPDESGKQLADLAPTAVAFNADAGRVAVRHLGGRAVVWDVAARKPIFSFESVQPRQTTLARMAFSPDGTRLVTGTMKTVKVWDVGTGREVHSLDGHTDYVGAVDWSPDGSRIASASGDKTVKLWDSVSGQEVQTLRGHSGAVLDVAYSADGKRLATASGDGTVKVWDALTGQEALTLSGRATFVMRVAFSPDGRRLACGNDIGQALVWDAPPTAAEGQATRRRVLEQTQLTWHRERAETANKEQQWFMAAFHLGHLLRVEPDNLRYRVRRALALASCDRPDEAKPEFVEAMKRREALTDVERAEAHAFLGEYAEAGEFFLKATKTRPEERRRERERQNEGKSMVTIDEREALVDRFEDIGLKYRYALLRLHAGDLDGYRKTCEAVLKGYSSAVQGNGFSTPFDVASANLMAWLCALGPDAVKDLPAALKVIDAALQAQPGHPVLLYTRGCLLSRAGKDDEALKVLAPLNQARAEGAGPGLNLFLLAMAMHRSGKTDEAKKLFEQLTAKEPEKFRGWSDRLEWLVLRREAEELIRGKDKEPDKPTRK